MKSCPRCGNTFPLERFSKNRAKADGHQTHCKTCMTAAKRRWMLANPRKYKTQATRYSRMHPKPYTPGDAFARTLWRGYKLTVAAYNEMLEGQGGRCAICGIEPTKIRLAVDHDHDTGRIRALLCSQCNTGIGMLGDDVDNILAAAAYVAAHKASEEKTGAL